MLTKFVKPQLIKISSFKFGMMENYYQKKQQQNFNDQMDLILKNDRFTLKEYKNYVDENLAQLKKGVLQKIMSSQEQEESQLLAQKKILNAFLEDELTNYRKVEKDFYIQQEIAEVAETTLQEVKKCLQQFKQIHILHNWMHQRKKEGKQLPQSQEELNYHINKGFTMPYEERKEQSRYKLEEQLQSRKFVQKLWIMKKRQKALQQKNVIYKVVKKTEKEY